MKELANIIKDISTGNLPVREIPNFVLYLLRLTFTFWNVPQKR
jgi:hypothetical protein